MTRTSRINNLLAATVLLHLGITVAHANTHLKAQVALSNTALLFVFMIVLAGPIVGLIMQRTAYPRGGAWLIAATLGGAFCFGVANHFLIPGADHVSHVMGAWRALFQATAVFLAVTEFLASGMAVWCATGERSQP